MYKNSALQLIKNVDINKLDSRGKQLSKIKQITWEDIDKKKKKKKYIISCLK